MEWLSRDLEIMNLLYLFLNVATAHSFGLEGYNRISTPGDLTPIFWNNPRIKGSTFDSWEPVGDISQEVNTFFGTKSFGKNR